MEYGLEIYTYIYMGIGVFAYFVILFLTFRDMRIFRRTGYDSYRKGAFKGIIASSMVLLGLFLMQSLELIGIALVFLGVLYNRKGPREKVFTTANAFDRFTGKTDIVLTNEEKKEFHEKQLAEKNQFLKEKEKADRREKMKEQREKDDKADEKEELNEEKELSKKEELNEEKDEKTNEEKDETNAS
ncbi:hypothetical protein MmiHf6_09530 [Methanimicrococcus hongohii]|uniref:Uncharacterized protein n=1 Tax=Methanimicrococcus hongohii TaxID=3028295 RepID=A0AA96ZSN0_9EURY|nr:hypothetical protein [Methanimicrococcus sp. Hf6]WNY23644.1 hypothetical protein MmiHf6_09530 [Methanimicrococcus sp. Hf6]